MIAHLIRDCGSPMLNSEANYIPLEVGLGNIEDIENLFVSANRQTARELHRVSLQALGRVPIGTVLQGED